MSEWSFLSQKRLWVSELQTVILMLPWWQTMECVCVSAKNCVCALLTSKTLQRDTTETLRQLHWTPCVSLVPHKHTCNVSQVYAHEKYLDSSVILLHIILKRLAFNIVQLIQEHRIFLTSSSLNQYNNIYQIRVIVNCAVKVAYPQISSRQLPHFEVPPDASFAFLSIAAGTAPPSCGGSLAWSSRSPRLDQSRKIHVFGKHFVRYASVFVLVVICCNMLQGNHLYFQEWCWQQPGLFNSLSCP